MKMRLLVAASKIILMFPVLLGITAEAAEIKVLSAITMQPILEDLGQKFERATGHKLAFTFDNTRTVVKRVEDGETADVVLVPRQEIDSFVKNGKAVAGNVTAIASSRGFGVAVRKDAPKPDISSPAALRRTLLAAKSITYSASGGADAMHVAKVFERLGIANEMRSKTVFSKTRPGRAGPADWDQAPPATIAQSATRRLIAESSFIRAPPAPAPAPERESGGGHRPRRSRPRGFAGPFRAS